jgi:hypothetical protein
MLLIFGLGLVVLTIGCNNTRFNILPKDSGGSKPAITSEMLVNYLNQNSERLKTLRCVDVRVVASKGVTGIFHIQLDGKLMAQQPRDFRLVVAEPGMKTGVDLGSNGQEFWYWIRDFGGGQSYQFFCSYDDLKAGNIKANMPLPPFQPDWIMETLGMSDYGPPTRYQLNVLGDRIELIEQAKSPRGQPVQKVIVFNRKPATGDTPQVVAFVLKDAKGKEICSAQVQSVQLASQNAAKLPRRMTLNWPEERISLSLTLNAAETKVDVPATAFVRQPMDGIPSVNLATGKAQPTSIQPVQGFSQK